MTLGLNDNQFAHLEDLVGLNQIDQAKEELGESNCARRSFIESAIFLAENDIEGALTSLEECMNRCRTPSTRDPVLEARARMLRGLCRSGLGESIEASADLRWAMDRLNAINPGYIETQMTKNLSKEKKVDFLSKIPLNRFGKANEVSELTYFLASDLANYISGQTINIDGGMVV